MISHLSGQLDKLIQLPSEQGQGNIHSFLLSVIYCNNSDLNFKYTWCARRVDLFPWLYWHRKSSQYIKIFRADTKTIRDDSSVADPDQCQCGAAELTVQRSWLTMWPLQLMSSVTVNSLGAIILGDCDLLGKPGVANQPWCFVLAVPSKRQWSLCKRPALSALTVKKTRLLVSQVAQCQDQCTQWLKPPVP